MITDKQVIERLRQYEQVFAPAFRYISTELGSPNPTIAKISALLDDNDAELAFLDFSDLVHDIQRTKKKLATPVKSGKTSKADIDCPAHGSGCTTIHMPQQNYGVSGSGDVES